MSRHGGDESGYDDQFSPRRVMRVVKSTGLLVAWGVGAAAGWFASARTDLLGAVARGAFAWIATLVVWNVGARIWESALPLETPDSEEEGISKHAGEKHHGTESKA